MVSDQEISRCVESLLRQSPPGAVTSVNVVHHLESKLGVDLSHKASFIRDQIDLLLLRPPQKDHFALHPHPQSHFHLSPSPSSSNYYQQHVPLTGYDLGFRYPAPPPPQAMSAVASVHQQFHQQQLQHQQQQQQQQLQLPAVSAPPVIRPVVLVPSPKQSAPAAVKRRGGPGGLSKVCGVSPELQAIVGEPAMARTEIVKQLWAYIRKNNLQDPNNKRKIICNDALRLVFETDCTDMFKMNKLLAKHIITLGPTNSGPDKKRLKATPPVEVASAIKTEANEHHLIISDALAEFFGTGEREMLQSEALRRICDYIKDNNLECWWWGRADFQLGIIKKQKELISYRGYVAE